MPNHTHRIVACDFFISVTAGFQIRYVFVALEIGSRRLVHFQVTEHLTADGTLQQLREALPGDQDYKFLLHDRHTTFSTGLDEEVESWGIHVLKSPVRMLRTVSTPKMTLTITVLIHKWTLRESAGSGNCKVQVALFVAILQVSGAATDPASVRGSRDEDPQQQYLHILLVKGSQEWKCTSIRRCNRCLFHACRDG